jgi:hypothetical protein
MGSAYRPPDGQTSIYAPELNGRPPRISPAGLIDVAPLDVTCPACGKHAEIACVSERGNVHAARSRLAHQVFMRINGLESPA